eukprot:jgi/Hompol1/6645/HPOL_002876-RA
MRSLADLEAWFATNGIVYDSDFITIRQDKKTNAFSVHNTSSTSLAPETTLCVIPKDATLSVRNCGIADILEENGIGPTELGLAIAIMFERSQGPRSPWHTYLQTIPQREPIPIFWPQTLLSDLKGTRFAQMLNSTKTNLEDDYNEIVKPLVETYPEILKEGMDYQAFLDAFSIVWSRAFHVDVYRGDSLVPLADLFNHKTDAAHVHFEANVYVYADSCPSSLYGSDEEDDQSETDIMAADVAKMYGDDRIEMTIVRPCEPNAEVFNTYGDHSNAMLLQRYGFLEPGNPHSTLEIPSEMLLQKAEADAPDSASLQQRVDFLNDGFASIIQQVVHFVKLTQKMAEASAKAEQAAERKRERAARGNADEHDQSSDNDDHDDDDDDDDEDDEDDEADVDLEVLEIDYDGQPSIVMLALAAILVAPFPLFTKWKRNPETAVEFFISVYQGEWPDATAPSSTKSQRGGNSAKKGKKQASQKSASNNNKGVSATRTAVFKLIRDMCGDLLRSFPTTIEQDQQLLGSGDGKGLGMRRWAIMMRLEEKTILKRAMD